MKKFIYISLIISLSFLALHTKAQAPPDPVANLATSISYNGFRANWIIDDDSLIYFIDVAYDTAFTHFVPGFQNLCVANAHYFFLSGFIQGTNYFYRLKASNGTETSCYSNRSYNTV